MRQNQAISVWNAENFRIGSAAERDHINSIFTIAVRFCIKWLICINHTNMTKV